MGSSPEEKRKDREVLERFRQFEKMSIEDIYANEDGIEALEKLESDIKDFAKKYGIDFDY